MRSKWGLELLSRLRRLLVVACILGATGLGATPAVGDDPAGDSDAGRSLALSALATATSAAGVIMEHGAPGFNAEFPRCYVWQQPGVALTITGVTGSEGEPPELWMDMPRLVDFFKAQRNLQWSAPFVHPSEPAAGAGGIDIDPVVCLLDGRQARERLGAYLKGYLEWQSCSPEQEFIQPNKTSLRPDYAVVYIDPWGVIEFYFVEDGAGPPQLVHFIHYMFFSA